MNLIPPHRLFIVKTRELGSAGSRMADFLGISRSNFDASRMPKTTRERRFELATSIPPEFLRRKVMEHCAEVMSKIFQKTWTEITSGGAPTKPFTAAS